MIVSNEISTGVSHKQGLSKITAALTHLLHEYTERGENALAQYRIPGAIQPLIGGQSPGVRAISLEQLFHLLSQRFAIDLGVDLIVAHRTEAIQIGRPDGGYSPREGLHSVAGVENFPLTFLAEKKRFPLHRQGGRSNSHVPGAA